MRDFVRQQEEAAAHDVVPSPGTNGLDSANAGDAELAAEAEAEAEWRG